MKKTLLLVLVLVLVVAGSVWAQGVGSAEENLKRKNISLPTPASPVANYVPAVRVGTFSFYPARVQRRTIRAGRSAKS